MDSRKSSSFSKYKKLIGKVFGFSSDEDDEKDEEYKRSTKNTEDVYMLGKPCKDLTAIKTLTLDLTNVANLLNITPGKYISLISDNYVHLKILLCHK